MTTSRLEPFGTTIFSEMTALAQAHGAVNLAQGFPDFEGPPAAVEAAVAALRSARNQYAPTRGTLGLRRALAARRGRDDDDVVDPDREVIVTAGATEAIAASLLGLLEPGDEALLFEPFYDSYAACVALAGGRARYVTLRHPDFALDVDEVAAAIGPRTRLIVLNTPHNPTGRVFDDDELGALARLCVERDLVVIADEVYERVLMDDARHRSIRTFEGMRERTLAIGSAGKTFAFTGWKVGWAVGPSRLIDAVAAAHQFLTFSTATPLQDAVAAAVEGIDEAFDRELREAYGARRDLLVDGLSRCGFLPAVPRGACFVLADFTALSDEDDRTFARTLTTRAGVAPIPPSPFYARRPEEGRRLLRFAFCKRLETIAEGVRRLEKAFSS